MSQNLAYLDIVIIIIINGLKIMARNGLRLLMLQERMLNDKKKKKKPGSDLLQTINHF